MNIGVPGDQGGHLVGYRFLPEQGEINLFPQGGNSNMAAYKALENDCARYVNRGYQVDFEHTLSDFDPVNGRPASISVDYAVKDSTGNVLRSFNQKFDNAAGQTYVRGAYR
ncbi:DNA/RNA non-specific endonuclease [Paraburkholderia nodosa]|uniref:DNA/RNA non-specific endonuclease n=1 Tax=Paraburkholderia nodosa TaxID=392320 RepID=UPI0009F16357